MKNLFKVILRLSVYGSFFVSGSIFFSACVPTPAENTNVPPKITDLHLFFTPQDTGKTYLWHHIPQASGNDAAYTFRYAGKSNTLTSEGYSPISLFELSDTSGTNLSSNEAYISDSLIVYYFGKSDNPLTSRQIVLRDTLQVGASWNAATDFVTSNGAHVSIRAVVQNYYPETSSAGTSYQDVFVVSYTATVKGSQIPAEPEFQNGAHISRYYARGIGDILDRCIDAKDSLVWTNELTETRIR